jgi:ADP-heptose:LPS heptosyltransferase
MFPYIKKKAVEPITLREHHERRNKILIKRRVGGYGDILMQRMMFEDFSKFAEITYSCPRAFLPFAENHPYAITVPIEELNPRNYGIIYDISTACRVHESKYGMENKLHRSDIWSQYCGVTLKNHEAYFRVENTDIYKSCLYEINPKKLPMVLIASSSTNCEFGIAKSMTENQVYQLCKRLTEKGYFLFTIHNEIQEIYKLINVPQFTNIELQSWAGLVNSSDYVISVDTATFHLAGILKKPLLGIFSFTDGKVYGKYYDFELVQKHKDNGDWSCGPCFRAINCPKSKDKVKPCMTELSIEEIMRGFDRLVEKKPYIKSTETPASANNC